MIKEYRSRWIHHFCVSQFTWIHKLSMMIQFNSIHLFLDVQKRLNSQLYSIEVNNSTMTLSVLWQTGEEQFNYDSFSAMANWRGFHSWVWNSYTFPQFIYEFHLQNTANTSPLHICLISSQPACTWLISYKADCHLMLPEMGHDLLWVDYPRVG